MIYGILKLKRKAIVLVRQVQAHSMAVCGCMDKAIVEAKAKRGGEPLSWRCSRCTAPNSSISNS